MSTVLPPPPIKPPLWQTELIYWLAEVIVETFFREISLRGSFNVPTSGPTIVVVAPHANQFLDAAITMYGIKKAVRRETHFIEAAVSLRRPVIGALSRMTGCIPVERAQDLLAPKEGMIRYKDYPADELAVVGKGTHFLRDCAVKGLVGLPNSSGNVKIGRIVSDTELVLANPVPRSAGVKLLQDWTTFKASPRVNNHQMFDAVFDCLRHDFLIGIASEGGSHDRTQLLPLQPGVAIMALGAVAKYPEMNVRIVPCGLNYFHAHKFRSRAVLDFGKPIVVDAQMAAQYTQDARGTVGTLMETITHAMNTVTVQSPDFETLQVIQAARRLYTYGGSRPDGPLSDVVKMNRNLLTGYSQYKDDPEIVHLKQSVMDYNTRLSYYGLRDHEVETVSKSVPHNALLLVRRLCSLLFYATLALPGTVLFSPVFIACKIISARKQKQALAHSVVKVKANDVLGSWKVLIALVVAPICYLTYSILGTLWIHPLTWFGTISTFVLSWIILVCATYSSLRMGEVGLDILKSIRPLVLSLSPESTELAELKTERTRLAMEVTQVINNLGPKVFPEFKEMEQKEKEEEELFSLRRREALSASSSSTSLSSLFMSRPRTTSTSSSVYSGFSVDGKMPDLSHVTLFPDRLQVESDSEEPESALTSRIRDAVIQRNKAGKND